jgi:hypothetical protein
MIGGAFLAPSGLHEYSSQFGFPLTRRISRFRNAGAHERQQLSGIHGMFHLPAGKWLGVRPTDAPKTGLNRRLCAMLRLKARSNSSNELAVQPDGAGETKPRET